MPFAMAIERVVLGTLMMSSIFYINGWLLTRQFIIKRYQPILFLFLVAVVTTIFSIVRVSVLGKFPGNIVSMSNQLSEMKLPLFTEYKLRHAFFRRNFNGLRGPFLLGFLINAVLSTIAILLHLNEYKTEKERQSREELQRTQEAQITYLKSQVNPHFLFNTLNNLYGLTYSKSDLAPQMVLGLSDTMRYMIYETEQKLVPIEKEINFILNYLKLERMRISTPENIRSSIHIKHPSRYMPPLMLLPFVENCFKHGTIGKDEDGWMELDLWDDVSTFSFVCKNSFNMSDQQKKENSGIGLKNIQKRLELLFDDNFQLSIQKQDNEFMVSLQIPVSNTKSLH